MAKTKKAKSQTKKSSYTIAEAQSAISRLVKLAADGREVILTDNGVPIAKIIRYEVPHRKAGSMKGRLTWTDDVFDPLNDQEMKDLGFE
ncbi:Prevent-host-death protein [Candidatus Koribacter versatilis Ellin345]|uniref:Prevent-host-death protein n=1 Tax=Koribacter versatilis (strain Ellin345) TaxID=204669 RepID=Q1ILL7_KORVE|nr:type II toxin-antitoxin system Phd/YefM family antitoxin [Candidatus Koribacter versatilis]ABF42233.1 Prevent-host-death protein [Candidatus Koribacter versatilis Ellin345]